MRIAYTLMVIVVFITIPACNDPRENDPPLNTIIHSISQKLKTNDMDKIREMTTENGFRSLMTWSDSLKNKEFINGIADNLNKGRIISVTSTETLMTMLLGEEDAVVGATGGYLILKREGGEMKIDEYKGGK